MTSTLTTEEVNDLIERHSDSAREAISQLATYCQQDENGRTLMNTAITFRNPDIIELLAASDEAIHFAPSLDEELHDPVKFSVSAYFNGQNTEQTEQYLANSFSPNICLQRTPLHVACRYADVDSIALLLSKGADTSTEDALGMTPFELCIQFGGPQSVNRFITCCIEKHNTLHIRELALQMLCVDADTYQLAIEHGALDDKARRFAFNLACAMLDKEGMECLLKQGLGINKTLTTEFSPVLEVCTSRLLTFHDHPEAPRLAGQYAASGPPSTSIHIDNEAIQNAEGPKEIAALFDKAQNDVDEKQRKATSYTLSEEERQSQLAQRLDLIDFLFERGLSIKLSQKRAPYGFTSDIISTNSPELVQALIDKEFSLTPVPDDADFAIEGPLHRKQFEMVDVLLTLGYQWGSLKKQNPDLVQAYLDWKNDNAADIVKLNPSIKKPDAEGIIGPDKDRWTWELMGESVLTARTQPTRLAHEKPATIRLIHNNVYGPVDDVALFVRIGNPKTPTAFEDLRSGGKWIPMKLIREQLFMDGEEVDRSSVDEPLYDETPWEAIYECELTFKQGAHSIEIRVVSEIEGMTGVISDWTVTVR